MDMRQGCVVHIVHCIVLESFCMVEGVHCIIVISIALSSLCIFTYSVIWEFFFVASVCVIPITYVCTLSCVYLS